MKILALEFSSAQRSVAVVRSIDSGPSSAADVSLNEVVETGPTAVNAIGMIDSALKEAKIEREQIEVIAVGLGPGSYHGIRQAIALAQGWQLAAGQERVKILGISSVECIAAEACNSGFPGKVQVVIDAQRGEFYVATYEIAGESLSETEPLRIMDAQQLRARREPDLQMIGPDVGKAFEGARLIYPRAATLGELALGKTDFIPGEKLEPIYLRETTFVKARLPPTRQSQ